MISNGSFEEVNPAVFNTLSNTSDIYMNHFNDPNFPVTNLFECWTYVYDPEHVDWGTSTNNGLVWGITPGFFHTYEGVEIVAGPVYPVIPTSTLAPVERIFAQTNLHTYGLRVQTDPITQQKGFDLSPPDTKFANNMYAEHGTNYVAMLDFRVINENNNAPGIRSKLKHKLTEGVKYTFTISAAKMNKMSTIVSDEEWGGTKNPKIWVYVVNSSNGEKQKILEEELTLDSWKEFTCDFIANKESEYIFISGDALDEDGLFGNPNITGCFIDNLKLYETCETPQNECLNINYRKDVLDASLETVQLTSSSPNNFPEPGTNHNTGYLETVRAKNLENVQRLEMKIYGPNNVGLVRTIDHWYPQSTYSWDGLDDSGTPLPESSGLVNTSKYKAVINAVSNECNHASNVDIKYFNLKRSYTVIDPQPLISSTIIDVGVVPAIHNLDRVHELRIVISSNGSTVYDQTILNPPSSIGLSTQMGNTSGLPQFTSGQYGIHLYCSNNCESNTEFTGVVNILNYNVYTGTTEPFFDWTPVSKPDIDCPYDFEYLQNFLPPQDCCEGSLYLSNVDINSSWNVNILNDIIIDEGTSFSPFYTNNLYAGQEISIIPAASGIDIYDETGLFPGVFNCSICRIGGTGDTTEVDESLNVLEKRVPKHFALNPNPIDRNQKFFISSGESPFSSENCRVSMFDPNGKEIDLILEKISDEKIKIAPATEISYGIYFINVESNGYYQHFELLVK